MANKDIATYLNDHLAGSVAALELMENLQATYPDSEIERFVAGLQADVLSNRQQLEALMARLDVAPTQTRNALAWLTGKFAEIKLRLDDPAGGALHLLESLEVLSLGLAGQIALWQGLAAATEDAPDLRVLDYEDLKRRTEDLRRRVEAQRLAAAREVLGASR